MAKMGKYCKAYPIERLRAFGGWRENAENVRRDKKNENGQEVTFQRELTGDDFLYLQENLTVTDGIFLDENIIFDDVTPEWENYCRDELQFQVPEVATA